MQNTVQTTCTSINCVTLIHKLDCSTPSNATEISQRGFYASL